MQFHGQTSSQARQRMQLSGIEHEVLGRLHALGEPRGIDRLHDVVLVDVDLGLGVGHRCAPSTGTRRWDGCRSAPRSLRRQFCMIAAATSTVMIGPVDNPIATASRTWSKSSWYWAGSPPGRSVGTSSQRGLDVGRTLPAEGLLGEVQPERREHRGRDQQEEDEAERRRRPRWSTTTRSPCRNASTRAFLVCVVAAGVVVSTWLMRSLSSTWVRWNESPEGGAIIDTSRASPTTGSGSRIDS